MRSILGLSTLALVFSATTWAAPDKMQGVQVGEGGTLSVRELPVPKAGAGEVLVKVRAAGVNPVDWKVAGSRVGKFGVAADPVGVYRHAAGGIRAVGVE